MSKGAVASEGPAWPPLQDNYMLTNSNLKDWDKVRVRILNHSLPPSQTSCQVYALVLGIIFGTDIAICIQERVGKDDIGRMSEDSGSDDD